MKIVLLTITTCLGLLLSCAGQTKVERWVVVSAHYRSKWISGGIVFELVQGQHPEYFTFRDSTVITRLQKVNEFQNESDLLNYMAGLGWTMAAVAKPGNYTIMTYYFKREFDPAELVAPGQ